MRIIATERFQKSLKSLDKVIRKSVEKKFILFLNHAKHPSLHIEKLEPKHKNMWSFRINKNFRVIFSPIDGETITLMDIGPHDIYKKKH